MDSIEVILAFIVVPTLSSIIFYLVGFGILSGSGVAIDETFKPLLSWIIGIVMTNLIASLFITSFVTVQLLLIPLLGLLFWESRKNGATQRWNFTGLKEGFATILLFTGIWTLIYLGVYLSLFLNDEIVQAFYLDLYYFVRIADNIWGSGQENIMNALNEMPSFAGGASPYHYFELYQTLLLSKPFELNPLWAFTVSLPIAFCSLGSHVLFVLLKAFQVNIKPFVAVLMATGLLFISGYNVLPFDYVENGAYSMNMMNNALPKYFPLFIPILLAGYYTTRKAYFTGLILICLLVVFSYTMAPMVLFIGFGGIVLLKISGEINWKQSLLMMAVLLFSVAFVLGFYKFNSVASEYQRLGVNYSEVLQGILNNPFSIIKRALGTHVYYTLDYLIFLVPIAFSILLTWKKNHRKNYLSLILFFLLIFEGGVIATTLLDGHHTQAWQPQYIALTIGSNAFFILVLLTMFQHQLRLHKIPAGIYCCVILLNVWSTITNYYVYADERMAEFDVSRGFYESAEDILQDQPSQTIVYLEDNPELPAIYPIGSVLTHINSEISLECIDQSIVTGSNSNYALCSFVEFSSGRSDADVEKAQLQYLQEFDIKYLIGYEATGSYPFLSSYSSPLLKDELSGLYVRAFDQEKIRAGLDQLD